MAGLLRLGLQSIRIAAVGIFDLAPAFSIFRAEQVAQDGEQPSRHVGAWLEGVDIGERAQQRLLDQVVRAVDVAAERNGEGAEARDRGENLLSKGGIEAHSVPSLPGFSS